MFVVDQFEEIFHPTNKGVPDAGVMVQRILDHFFNAAPALLHRASRCAASTSTTAPTYLELPEAINKSFYLVRRLDLDELREAIVGPAQRFLRLHVAQRRARGQQGAAAGRRWSFDSRGGGPAAARRASRMNHDPDHLPLLQHMLARLWQAAHGTRRDGHAGASAHHRGSTSPAPQSTAAAVARTVTKNRMCWMPELNALRACVENWPQKLCTAWTPTRHARQQFEEPLQAPGLQGPEHRPVFCSSAWTWTPAARLMGRRRRRAPTLLQPAGVRRLPRSPVHYLFWDDDDPVRVTLKVSHESFIRGWSRFRRLIDTESERFDEFVGVLRRCAAWDASGRREDLLLETGELRLLRESSFRERLLRPGQRQAWFRFLQLDRDGPRLGRTEAALDAFLTQSVDRQALREGSAKRRRRLALLSGLLVLFVPPAFFSIAIQIPVILRAELLLDAGNRANRAALTPDYPGVGAARPPLESLLRAAELIDVARTGQGSHRAQFSQWLLDRLSWISPVRLSELACFASLSLVHTPRRTHVIAGYTRG